LRNSSTFFAPIHRQTAVARRDCPTNTRWEHRYTYNQEIAHARLPEKCGVAVPADLPKGQNKITALKTSGVRNPNASIGNKEETIIIDKKSFTRRI
jgi:hypothetical protein